MNNQPYIVLTCTVYENCIYTSHAASGELCNLPGCTRPRYVDPGNGRVHDYCGRTHANEAQAKGQFQHMYRGSSPGIAPYDIINLDNSTHNRIHTSSMYSETTWTFRSGAGQGTGSLPETVGTCKGCLSSHYLCFSSD